MATDELEQNGGYTKRLLDDGNGTSTRYARSKRQRQSTEDLEPMIKLSHADYTVGWICALPNELAASLVMLDDRHENLPTAVGDTNQYFLGSIGSQNVVIAGLPSGGYGTNNAANVANNMMRSFPLMKYIFDKVKRSSSKNVVIASFFFNARGDQLEKSTFGLYRSLLFQLLETFTDLQKVLDDLTLIPLTNNGCPPTEIVQELLVEAIIALGSRQMTCFVDALDECDEAEVRRMVVFFERLEELAMDNNVQLRICFSSRHYPHIDVRYGLKLTLENRPGHKRDLRRYVEDHLRAGTGKYVETIRSGILDKARGVFMWVILVVEILNKEFISGRKHKVQKRLLELPPELGELFEDILRRDNTDMEEFLLCCQWVLFSSRPLRPEEFYFGMLSGLPEGQEGPLVYDPDTLTDEDMKLFVNGSSKGLAETTKSANPTVQFIHESVRDFLIKENGLQRLQSGHKGNFQSLSHDKLKHCCKSYISDGLSGRPVGSMPPFLEYAVENVLFHSNLAAMEVSQEDFLERFPMKIWLRSSIMVGIESYHTKVSLLYVAAYKNFGNLVTTLLRLHPDPRHHEKHPGLCFFTALSRSNWAAARGFLAQTASDFSDAIIFPFAHRKFNYNPQVSDLNPLSWAIKNDHLTLAKLMVPPDYFDCALLDSYGRSPLHWAAMKGDETLVNMLVEKAVLNYEMIGVGDASSVSVCCNEETRADCHHHKRIAYIDLHDRSGVTPLMVAIEYLHEGVIRLLLDWGAVPDRNLINHTHQLRFPHPQRLTESITKLFIKQKMVCKSALLAAASGGGQESIIEMIVDSQKFFDNPHYNGAELLEIAAKAGKTTTVMLLLKKGAGARRKAWDTHGYVHQIASEGDEIEAQLLFGSGINLNSPNHAGDTPLHIACYKQRKTMVKILLESGADVNAKDKSGHTALSQASLQGQRAVVELLLSYGADINTRNHRGQTPLHHAARDGSEDVAKVLITHGADIYAPDRAGQNPRYQAALVRNWGVVKLLDEESDKRKRTSSRSVPSSKAASCSRTIVSSDGAPITDAEVQSAQSTLCPEPQASLHEGKKQPGFTILNESDGKGGRIDVILIESSDDEQ